MPRYSSSMTQRRRSRNYRDHLPKDFTLRDEANAITAWAFRNGPLERFHQGENSELLENTSLRRITGPEMKELMINASEYMEKILRLRDSHPAAYAQEILFFSKYCKGWVR